MRIRGKIAVAVQGTGDEVKELGALGEILLVERGVVIVDEESKPGTSSSEAIRIGALKGRLIPWARVVQITFESDEAVFTEF